MNELQMEILEKYQVRKTGKQKKAFRDFAVNRCEQMGYGARVEKGGFGAKNIVVGDPASAKVVYTAHYDTCPRLPFPNFITPKNFLLYLLYQIAIIVILFALTALSSGIIIFVLHFLPMDEYVFSLISQLLRVGIFVILYLLILIGPANKHTANDNTSGVTLLFEIMRELPEDMRGNVAFVFFDLEEVGLFGSSGFAKKNKPVMKNKLLVNFDCISDGDNFLFALKKKAAGFKELIESAYVPNEKEGRVEACTKGVFYPSDQSNFPLGVGACALKSTKKGLLYMNKIHTDKDRIYREENIAFFTRGSVKLAELISNEETRTNS